MRIYVLLAGFVGLGRPHDGSADYARQQGGAIVVPLLILATTFELNFFVHTGVERIGRYIQVFFEEASGSIGWETTAMNYGAKFALATSVPRFRRGLLRYLYGSLPAPRESLQLSCLCEPPTRMDCILADSRILCLLTESSALEKPLRLNARWISIASAACYPSNWLRSQKNTRSSPHRFVMSRPI